MRPRLVFVATMAVLVSARAVAGCASIAGLDQYTPGPRDGGDGSVAEGASGDASEDSVDASSAPADVVDANAIDAQCDGPTVPCGLMCCPAASCSRFGTCGGCDGLDASGCTSDNGCCEPNHCAWNKVCVESCGALDEPCTVGNCCFGHGCIDGSCQTCKPTAAGCSQNDECCSGTCQTVCL